MSATVVLRDGFDADCRDRVGVHARRLRDMAFESAYTALLSGDSTTVITGNTLTLSSARGVLTFTR